jgi:2-dehydropantoate 2-reductase
VVKVSVYADKVLLGSPFAGVNSYLLRRLESDLNASGIPTAVVTSSEIWAALWGKVLYNSALNPLSALLEVSYGELGAEEETRHIMRTILGEIFQVLEQRGVKLTYKDHGEYYRYFMEKQLPPTRGHRSSMLQDILQGKKTEIDSLNGAISQYARGLGIATPYNDLITNLIKFKEKKSRK